MNGKITLLKMSKKKVILSLGGNQPDTLNSFLLCSNKIESLIGSITKKSSIYTSEAWGFKEETPLFYNQVIEVSTQLTPQEVLKKTQHLETELGRKSKTKNEYESRIIDIDILFYEQFTTSSKTLTIPHYLIHERRFILVPLLEILPNFTHPVFQKTIKQLLLQCKDTLEVKKL